MTLIGNAAQLPSMRRSKLLREMYFAFRDESQACPKMGNASIWARAKVHGLSTQRGTENARCLRTFLRRLHSHITFRQ